MDCRPNAQSGKISTGRILTDVWFIIIVAVTFAVAHAAPLRAQELRARIVPQLGHSGSVLAATFSPDGRFLLTGGGDSIARLWDVATGSELHQLVGHTRGIASVAVSSDGKSALTTGHDNATRLWDLESGRELRSFIKADSSFLKTTQLVAAAFSLDQHSVLTVDFSYGGGTFIRQWDTATGRELQSFKLNGDLGIPNSAAFSSDGRTALTASHDGKGVSGNPSNVHLWDVSNGQELRQFQGHTNYIHSIAVSRDGTKLLTTSSDKTVRLWAVENGRELTRLDTSPNGAESVAFSPDGQKILVGSWDENTVLLADAADGHVLRRITWEKPRNYRAGAASVAFSPNGQTILTGGADGASRLWDVESGQKLREFTNHADQILSMAVSSDGQDVLLGTLGQRAVLFNIATGRYVRAFSGHAGYVRSVALSPDGSIALTGSADNTARLWDVTTGRELRELLGHAKDVSSLAFSSDGRSIVTGSLDGTARLWNVESGQELHRLSVDQVGVTSVAFAPDKRRLLTIGTLATPFGKIWDVKDGRELRKLPGVGCTVRSAAYSPDGRTFVTAGCDGTARIWDASSSKNLREFKVGDSVDVKSVAFSPNGRTILTGDNSNVVALWDAASGRKLREFKGHLGTINSVAFTPDGQRIVTGSNDGTVRVWDTRTSAEYVAVNLFSDGSWVTITPEGFFNASSPEAARNLRIVKGFEFSSVDQVYNALYRPDLVREKLAGDPNGKVKAAAAQLDLDKVMASGMAPKVTITSPATGSSSPTDEVTVEATIADQGGGIGKVEWRVNGVTLGLESRGLDRLDASSGGSTSKAETVKRTLSFEPGDNRIEIVAYNAKGLIASRPADVTIKWDGAKTASPPKLYVLAVGVNDYYDSRLHLAYAVPDATALADAFRKSGTGLYASVEVKTVLDSDVTVVNLDKVFADLSHKVQPRDVFVFFLAGHGKTENGRYYFLPRDFRYEDETSIAKAGMGQDKFQAWFAEIPARKSLLLYDTCESGSLTGATRGGDIDERLGALNRMARATGRTFLTATTDDAPALEGFHGHGVFTYALLDAFDHADVNHDGLIEISELADYIDQKVPDYSFEAFKLRQIPQRSIVGNNFALANKAEVLATTTVQASGESTTIPTKPTHVVVAPVDVKDTTSNTAITITHLAPGTQVRLMQTSGGWVLVARDGKQLGYVKSNAIAGLQ